MTKRLRITNVNSTIQPIQISISKALYSVSNVVTPHRAGWELQLHPCVANGVVAIDDAVVVQTQDIGDVVADHRGERRDRALEG